MSTKEIVCICERSFEVEVPDEPSFAEEGGLMDRVLGGDFLSFPCPHCGKVVHAEFPITFRSPPSGPDLFLIPEENRVEFLSGSYAVPSGCQCLIGYPEMVERLRMLRDGLDPRAVEVLKYGFQAKAEESYPEAEPLVSYHDREGGGLTFLVTGVVEGKVGKVKAPEEQYRAIASDIEAIAKKEPYASFLKPPYVCVKRLQAED